MASHKWHKYVIAALLILLVVLFVFLVHDYLVLRREHVINDREMFLSALVHKRGPVTAADIAFIRPWMTYGYVNTLFDLPADYLKDSLNVTNPAYPNLPLGTSTDAVSAALQSYFASK